MQQGPKVVIIGAGSYFFGKTAIWNIVTSEHLKHGTLALVDTNPVTLQVMVALAERAIKATGAPTKLISSVDRKTVMADADFVVLTFSEKNAYYRGIDTRITAKYGIRMCSSDTIGPGGIFRALREIPHVLAVADDVKLLAPNAWVINFINPTAVIGIALMRYAPEIKSFALCDGNHLPNMRTIYLSMAGIIPADTKVIPPAIDQKLDLRIAGVNHCTWVTECKYDGKDIMPKIREALAVQAEQEWLDGPHKKSKPRLNKNYALQLFDLYGAYPTAISHTKEYVPFFQGSGVTPNEPEPITIFDAYNRADEMQTAWAETVKLSSGETPIQDFIDNGYPDHATDIIESMWGNLNKPFFINTANRNAVTNMPDDAVLELKCDLDMNGPRPQNFGVMPRGLLGLQMQVLDTHELTAEAAVTFDHKTLLQAMCTDPLVTNIGDAKNIIKELLEIEKPDLPRQWYAEHD
jgi:alpha-galactosidase/6-phospho-beta-glucosidase family protein